MSLFSCFKTFQESSAKDDSETARCAGKEDVDVGLDHAEKKKKRWSRKKERDMAKERREKTRFVIKSEIFLNLKLT